MHISRQDINTLNIKYIIGSIHTVCLIVSQGIQLPQLIISILALYLFVSVNLGAEIWKYLQRSLIRSCAFM